MNVVTIGAHTQSNIFTALESIGFRADGDVIYYAKDTNRSIEFHWSSYVLSVYMDGSMIHGGISFSNTMNFKMVYEVIGDSVVFGFSKDVVTGNNIDMIISAPKVEEDDWLYCFPYLGTATVGRNMIVNSKAHSIVQYPTVPIYNGDAIGLQVCKFYDGVRFAYNMWLTSVCAAIPKFYQPNNTTNSNNYVEAKIDNTRYIIVNHLTDINSIKLAIEMRG